MSAKIISGIAFCVLLSAPHICSVLWPQDRVKTDTSEGDKAQIMAVLAEESAAFWNKDYDAYAACWVHAPYVRTMGWWADGGVTVVEGWEERAKRTRQHMDASPEPNSTASHVRRENINLRIFEDVAWLTFDQYGEDTGDALMDMPGRSRETRIFEKHEGKWKIVYVGWLLEG